MSMDRQTLRQQVEMLLDAVVGRMNDNSMSEEDRLATIATLVRQIELLCARRGRANEILLDAALSSRVEATRLRNEHDALVQEFQQIRQKLEARPTLVRHLSEHRRGGTRMALMTKVGQDFASFLPVRLTDGDMLPPPLGLCLVNADAGGTYYLGPFEGTAPLQAEEYTDIVAARPQTALPGIGEVVCTGPEGRRVLFAPTDVAREVERHLSEGLPVAVRSEGGVVRELTPSDSGGQFEDWCSFPDPDGPTLDQLVFSPRLRQQWERDVQWMIKGRALRVLLIGPTGTGKSSAVERAARRAAREAGRRFALITVSGSSVGNSLYGETERTIGRAFKRARALARNNHLVVILLDEADALLGASAGRFEGSVDRRVRLTCQQLLSEEIPGVAVYATMNPRSDSFLPPAIERRFMRRSYPRMTRSQAAQVCAGYAEADALSRIGLSCREFGQRVADYLFSSDFVVARACFQSGERLDVLARDLHNACPGKLKDLVVAFCRDVEDGLAKSLVEICTAMEEEFRSNALDASNLWDLTFLSRPAHDAVKLVEPVARRPEEVRPVLRTAS